MRCLPLLAAALLAAAGVPEDYRMEDYDAPVPSELPGGTVVGPEGAHDLWKAGGTVFIDVMPRPPKPKGLPEGTLWRQPPRDSIPGAIWMPNVGYGAIADVTDAWFREGLAEATGGEMDHPVLFFCQENCWMSWNAAKRALEYGYSDVTWLPEGMDGWMLWDYPTEAVQPREGEPN